MVDCDAPRPPDWDFLLTLLYVLAVLAAFVWVVSLYRFVALGHP